MQPNRAATNVRAANVVLCGFVASGCLSFTQEMWLRRDGSSRVLNTIALDPDFVRASAIERGEAFAGLGKELEKLATELGRKPGVRWARARAREDEGGRQFDLEYDVDDARLLGDLGRTNADRRRGESQLPVARVERIGRSEMAVEVETSVPRAAGLVPYGTVASLEAVTTATDEVIVRIHGPRIMSATGAVAADRRLVEWRFPLKDFAESRQKALPPIRTEVALRPWSMTIVTAAIAMAVLILIAGLAVRGTISGSGVAGIVCLAAACLAVSAYVYVDSGHIGKPSPAPEPGPPPTTVPPGRALPLTLPTPPAAPPASPPPPVDVMGLRGQLRSSERATRIDGLANVTRLGPRAVDVAEDIVPMLSDSDPSVRARAVRALSATASAHARAIVPLLYDTTALVKVEAACALVSSPYAGMTPALLTDQLAQKEETVRGRAAECLGELGPRAVRSVPALMAAVTNVRGGAYARYTATAALGRIGPAASQAIPVLEAATTDPERYVRDAAVEALQQVRGQPKAAPGVVPMAVPSPGS